MAAEPSNPRWRGRWQTGLAFAVACGASLVLVAFGYLTSALTIERMVVSLAVIGIAAAFVAPSSGGLGGALTGGWVALVGYGLVYSLASAGSPEAGLNGAAVLLMVVVPVTIGPGFGVGYAAVRCAVALRRRARGPG